MDFMTREVFDTLILIVILVGGALAAVRLYRDFTRPLSRSHPAWSDEDTQPNPAQHRDDTTETKET